MQGREETDFNLGGRSDRMSKKEWDRIERDVPQSVRAVGSLFCASADALIAGEPVVNPKIHWDQEAWAVLQGEAPSSAPSATKKKPSAKCPAKKGVSAADIVAKNRAAMLREDREKALGAKSCPTWRDFGGRDDSYDKSGRIESYVFGLLSWAKRRSIHAVDKLVSLRRCADFLEQNVLDVPSDVMQEFVKAAAYHAPSVPKFVELLAEDESFLTTPSFRINGNMKLHLEQEECMNQLLKSINTKRDVFLCKYQTPPSGGKTSTAALLGACLQREKRARDTYVIYTCYSSIVRVDVCKHLVAASVPFAIVKNGLASPSTSCYENGRPADIPAPAGSMEERIEFSMKVLSGAGRQPRVLVCDVASAGALLARRSRDVLLFDEPTANMSTDVKEAMNAVLQVLPRRTVFMSATMSDGTAWDDAVEAFTERHGEVQVCDISPRIESTRQLMSVSALDPRGDLWCPHHFGHSPEEIQQDFHLYRFYSPRVFKYLIDQEPRNVDGICLDELLTYDGVRRACMKILCNGTLAPAPQQQWQALEAGRLCTSHAHRFLGTTLALSSGGSDDFYKFSVEPLLKQTEQDEHTKLNRLLEKAGGCAKAQHSKSKVSKAERNKEEDDDTEKQWPLAAVVNSETHMKRFAGVEKKLASCRLPPPLPDELVNQSAVPLATSALCGVLLMGSSLSDSFFELTAQSLAEEAKAAYVCSGRDMIYGVNLPVNRVLVDLEVDSYAEMRQLCGRAGRTGRASSAEIVFAQEKSLALAMRDPRLGLVGSKSRPATEDVCAGTSAEIEDDGDEHDSQEHDELACEGYLLEPANDALPCGLSEVDKQGELDAEVSTNASTTQEQSKGRKSSASKSFHNLQKAAVKWQRQLQLGHMSQEELAKKILESRVAEILRQSHGDDFCPDDFIRGVLRQSVTSPGPSAA